MGIPARGHNANSSTQVFSLAETASAAMSTTEPQPLPVSSHASPSPTGPASPSGQYPRGHYTDLLGSPPIPPPRTSSTHHSHYTTNAAPAASSGERVSGSRRNKQKKDDEQDDSGGDRSARDRNRAADRTGGETEPSHRPRRAPGGPTHRTDANAPAGPRAEAASGLSSSEHETLVKEPSAVINQMLVSDPAVDIERAHIRQAAGQASSAPTETPPRSTGGGEGVEGGGRGTRSRQDHTSASSKRKETTFGSYILGQTLGEGEFGKVKLGWKRDGSVQVAIKLIRRESLGTNPSRLPKIYREISILRDLSHPNIVRLHEMVETDRHIGIIMEYASGGELFDHILNNRYLKDNAARRLFAQLVSGVGYLHKKGIVHRDLKLENLLLDRNRNIIITDFGFANTFDPNDDLDEEIEYNLTNKEFVKRMQLDKINSKGMRRGDLMQTSCGSPCYAAPELVVSDSLYTGRKVDVWSCGVILYAMLAGYLPFDDDPANPDGDNINLLYKYIVTTPLTFPEYVTPHARDLLRRILVPDPRKRADLFEVARHSWLSDYAHIVSHITSSTTKVSDIATTSVPGHHEAPSLARSASVREPPKTSHPSSVSVVGGLSHHTGDVSKDSSADKAKTSRDTKRRTVQVEYVAPQSQTTRGEPSSGAKSGAPNAFAATSAGTSSRAGKTRAQDSVQDPAAQSGSRAANSRPPAATPGFPPTSIVAPHMPRSTSDTAGITGSPVNARPTTGGSVASFNAGRLPSRGSYSQPVAPTVAATNAQGSLAQPTSKQYVISAPIPQDPSQVSIGRPSTQQLPTKYYTAPRQEPPKSHKRSSTVSGLSEKIFGRSGSIFGGRSSQAAPPRSKADKRYPPPSMKDPVPARDSRTSLDSRRSGSYSYNRKMGEAGPEKSRRFSLLPASFSVKGLSAGSREQTPTEDAQAYRTAGHPQGHYYAAADAAPARARGMSHATQDTVQSSYDGPGEDVFIRPDPINYQTHIDEQFAVLHDTQSGRYQSPPSQSHEYYNNPSGAHYTSNEPTYHGSYSAGVESGPRPSMQAGRPGRGPGVLQKNNRKFADAYEFERTPSHHSGSSGAARKVMDFFRRRAKSRSGDER